jgi:hypothetical protein
MDSKTDSKLGHLGAQWVAEIIGDVKKRRDNMQYHLSMMKNEGHYKQAHVDALAVLNAMVSAAAPQVVVDDLPTDPVECAGHLAGMAFGNFPADEIGHCVSIITAALAAPVHAQEPVAEIERLKKCLENCNAEIAQLRGDRFSGRPAAQGDAEDDINAEVLSALQDITDDICERFDMNSSSTNPGIKNCVERARAAIAAKAAS